jgi:hypothetical protein
MKIWLTFIVFFVFNIIVAQKDAVKTSVFFLKTELGLGITDYYYAYGSNNGYSFQREIDYWIHPRVFVEYRNNWILSQIGYTFFDASLLKDFNLGFSVNMLNFTKFNQRNFLGPYVNVGKVLPSLFRENIVSISKIGGIYYHKNLSITCFYQWYYRANSKWDYKLEASTTPAPLDMVGLDVAYSFPIRKKSR